MLKISYFWAVFLTLALKTTLTQVSGEASTEKEINFEDISLTSPQRIYFNKFKAQVINDFPEAYMRKDMYLIKWLQATDYKVDNAVEKIRKMISWRAEYKMDQIMKEDFSDLERQFPIRMDAVDYVGRPVGTADIAEWDVRKVVLMGNKDKGIRFVFRMAEVGVLRVMEQHEQHPNVSSGIIIMNLDGFNSKQHGCPECIPICRNLIVALESYFPFMIHRFIGINTPMSFYSVFSLFAPLMKKHVRNVIKIYGPDKRQWKPAILSLISPDQIEQQFGGTRIYN
ncbi:SEC14-like protein 4 [Folsomia candida]|uniref:Patellin-4 n=1 Tax=Folsomia candida TaxID=158441 RepID=A0A226E2N1_FOLCA|nr:SEC14-like protein 4 [Folsomia candida]OXA51833.1 Patellin-4 [Folsomia candida]